MRARARRHGGVKRRAENALRMLARLIALLLLATTLAASADSGASALALPHAPPADWKALLCAVLVLAYIARRRSRWHAE